jgi:tetratricopeptide (TPR) repeat protein
MFGNRLGWGISAAIFGLFFFVGYLIVMAGVTSGPTAFALRDPTLNAPVALPVVPQTIVRADQPGVAGPLYRKAIDDYLANEAAYEKNIRDNNPDLAALLPGQQALIDATHLAQMDLFATRPEAAISYTTDLPELDALGKVAQSLLMLALRNEKANNTERAIRYYDAVFALGAKLVDERISYAEVSMGLGQMATAAIRLEKIDPRRAEQIKAFREGYETYSPKLLEVQKKINSMDPKVSYAHAGDVYHIAINSKYDRLWRVESILKLGRYRFNARRPGDQRRALPTLRRYLKDRDPAIRHAAKLAYDLTEIEYRKLGR